MQANDVRTIAKVPSIVDGVGVGIKDRQVATAALATGAVVADKVAAAEIIADRLSAGISNFSNLWPNGTSEINPPSSITSIAPGGADTATNAEFDFRYNAGAGAYAGVYVRRLMRSTAGTTTIKTRPFPVVSDGSELYFFASRHKYIATGGTPTAKATVRYLDASFAQVGVTSATIPTGDTSWQPTVNAAGTQDLNGTAPAAAVYVEFELTLATAASGAAEILFDVLHARRGILGYQDLVESSVPHAKLSVTPQQFTSGQFGSQSIGNTYTDLITLSAIIATSTGRPVLVTADFSGFHDTAGNPVDIRLVENGTAVSTVYRFYFNNANVHAGWSFSWIVTPAASGGTTYKVQVRSPTAGNFKTDANDYYAMTAVEL